MPKEVYVIRVDKICSHCGYKNEINTVVYEPVEVIACGRCGEYLMIPDDFPPDDRKKLTEVINDQLKGKQ